MDYQELDIKIRETLKDIFRYLGVDEDYSNDATVRTYVEHLIEQVK